MSAIDWHKKMTVAPRLRHSDGMVLVDLDGRSVVFPSEADARFFVAAYTDVPNMAGEIESLRAWLDEGALHAAEEKVRILESQVRELARDKVDLQAKLASEAERVADVSKRAALLARTLRKIRDQL